MRWYAPEDATSPVFTPEGHIRRKYPEGQEPRLPPKAVMFCLGRGLPVLRERFSTEALLEELAGFITHTPVLQVSGHGGVCFLHGGYGAPQAATTVESIRTLGVREVLLVGLCGVFAAGIQVGDVLVPSKILSEEGTSLHYKEQPGFAQVGRPDASGGIEGWLRGKGFRVAEADTVNTDAPYRQTFRKEALWREKGCVGVDMEASAVANLCGYYGMLCTVALMASDKHPEYPGDRPWAWGSRDFAAMRDDFIEACICFSLQ